MKRLKTYKLFEGLKEEQEMTLSWQFANNYDESVKKLLDEGVDVSYTICDICKECEYVDMKNEKEVKDLEKKLDFLKKYINKAENINIEIHNTNCAGFMTRTKVLNKDILQLLYDNGVDFYYTLYDYINAYKIKYRNSEQIIEDIDTLLDFGADVNKLTFISFDKISQLNKLSILNEFNVRNIFTKLVLNGLDIMKDKHGILIEKLIKSKSGHIYSKALATEEIQRYLAENNNYDALLFIKNNNIKIIEDIEKEYSHIFDGDDLGLI